MQIAIYRDHNDEWHFDEWKPDQLCAAVLIHVPDESTLAKDETALRLPHPDRRDRGLSVDASELLRIARNRLWQDVYVLGETA